MRGKRRGASGSGHAGKRPKASLPVGISSCLLGERVRFDGGHKRARLLASGLGRAVAWVPVRPEVEAGMGVPREPVRLLRQRGQLRMVGARSGKDYTEAMRAWARRRVRALERLGLCGYVLKKDSPSCGMEGVLVHDTSGRKPSRSGRGLFAEVLIGRLGGLPVEEERRLGDPEARRRFLERVLAYGRAGARGGAAYERPRSRSALRFGLRERRGR